MNPQSAAISGSGNPLKSLFESEIRAKMFSKSALRLPIHLPLWLCEWKDGADINNCGECPELSPPAAEILTFFNPPLELCGLTITAKI